ncbi:MAG: tRNA (adenosine(37)-N6)-threonylcarbamoyltransferase complex ATPase subunit type 1 TsaE [Bdellovibrionales bacterium]
MPLDNIPLPDLAATQSLAKRIAPLLKKGDVVALTGELGTGKTEFARALLQTMGTKGDVPSPTFTLVQTYEVSGLLVFHFDLYRLKSSSELDELGWDDALAQGVTLVEWPERAERRLPLNRLTLRFSLAQDEKRSCSIEKGGDWERRI